METLNKKEIQLLLEEEMGDLVELFDKKQLDHLANALVVNDQTRRLSLEEFKAIFQQFHEALSNKIIENAVKDIQEQIAKPENLGYLLEKIKPIKGKDYFTPQDKKEITKEVLSGVRLPKAGIDYFTPVDKENISQTLYGKIVTELLTRKEYAIKSVDIDKIIRTVVSSIEFPKQDTPQQIAAKISNIEGALDIKSVKGAVTLEDVITALKDPKGKSKLSAEHILNMPARGLQDQRWHGAGDTVVAGTNITITTNSDGQKVISSSGGSGSSVETPVGTVNGVNTVFTVSHEPKWVVSDSMTYFAGFGYTYLAGTITMDALIPPTSFIRSIY